ncbi:regulation of enolase protein 1 (concanavalin A-like superfamily) [Paenibacillus phyllosphaerae]|uniref:Regulation of enolase protein 1 (Concanavalin A-like superfamily) n=1 Tax=Paenibacillus phyllosphaerae TaxID=274593 RepID=A0A7W5AT13_9BACL|nr:PA14 domain-containing protein [Paenibacillus phyllosphaerae]MBB3108198.1 regulation of enolase protein 1 (concanavalin A-like superfamily) [Paenibacillus phyllosphaerae]
MALQVNMARIARLLVLTMLITFIHAYQTPFSYAAETAAEAEEAEAGDVHGLKADYYTSSGPSAFNFGTLKSTVIDPQINFSGLEPVFSTLVGQNDNVNVRWTGQIMPTHSETYTFSMIGDNGFRLWVDNKLIIDHWVNDWDKEQVGQPIALQAGVKYNFKIEYFENNGGSNLYLRWQSPSVAKQIVPADAFYLPDNFSFDGPTSGVIAESGLTADLQFGYKLSTLPANLKDSLKLSVSGTDWPITSIGLKEGDSSIIQLTFANAVYGKDAKLVHVRYDGNGGLQTEDGRAVASFANSIVNNSKFQIMTPWADDVDPDNVLPEYPRPQFERTDWLNLNGEWEFEAAEQGDAVPTGETLEENILVPFAAESVLSGINRVEDLMWYKRSFAIPESWDGKRVKLNFGAVDYLATVYVNGQQVGQHKGGYTSFDFDITEYLVAGENELIVHVLDQTDVGADQAVGKQTVKKLGGIWYTSISGIWQTVWLEPVASAHIEKLDMVTDINQGKLLLKPAVENGSGHKVEAIAKIGDEVVGTATGNAGEELAVFIPDAHLWSPDDPFLYDLEVRLVDGASKVVDEVDSYFGMREIKVGDVDGKKRILLNGEFVFQMGPLDQGYYPDGLYTAPTEEALKFDIETVKRLDMNMIRKHIKVEPARWYYWADKLGVLVWQDMPSLEDRQGNQGRDISQATKDQWMKEYMEMIDQLRSVPSIVVWTVFNEGWGQFDWGGQQTRDAVNRVKAYDPTRVINNASGWQDSGAGDLIDYHSYPGPNTPVPTASRAAVLGEYGGLGLHVPGHEWSPLVFSYQLMESKEQLTERYIQYIEQLKQFKNNQGLSAAVYTQITDVEYEINGLLSYDRKVEKMDFDAVAQAHRELIGNASKTDLATALTAARGQEASIKVGSKPGQYAQAVANAFNAIIASAQEVYDSASPTSKAIQSAINQLQEGRAQLFASVNDPIAAGAQVDSFDAAQLDAAWSIYRKDDTKWSLSENPGSLTLTTLAGDSYENANGIKNVFLKDAPEGDFSITFKVTAPINKNHQQAGLFIWANEDNYVRFGHVWDTVGSTGKSLETAYEKSGKYGKAANMQPHPGYDTAYLKLNKVGNTFTSYYWNGTAWVQAADPLQVELGSELKVGLYAIAATDGTSIPAKFDYFAVAPISSDPSATLSGTESASVGGAVDIELGAANVKSPFTTIDTIIHYDPSQLSFETVASEQDGKTTYALAEGAFSELRGGLRVVGTAVKPDEGSIRVIMASEGTANEVAQDGSLLQLHGTVKAGAEAGTATVTLSRFDVSKDGDETSYDTSAELQINVAAADKTALTAAIAEAQALHDAASEGSQPGEYPAGAKATLQAAINSAISVRDNAGATAEQVAAAITALAQAVDTFRDSVNPANPADKTALSAAIDAAQAKLAKAVEGTKLGQYEAGAKAALQTAIDAAIAVKNRANASQSSVDQATAALGEAVQQFLTRFISLIEGQTKVSIRDLSIMAANYRITSEDAGWEQLQAADIFDEGTISIRSLSAVARMILDDWSGSVE